MNFTYYKLLEMYDAKCWEVLLNNAKRMDETRFKSCQGVSKFFLSKDAPLPSIFYLDGMDESIGKEETENAEMIDLPFKCCIFQPIDGDFLEIEATVNDGDKYDVPINSILVLEDSPKNYVFVATTLQDFTQTGNQHPGFLHIAYDNIRPNTRQTYKLLVTALQKTCRYMARKSVDIGEAKVKHRVKHSGRGTKEKISKVIYVGRKKSIESKGHRSINWSHAWRVRGHWRKANKIGKDREGNYNQNGWTWVIPHVKGDGVLVEKVRII